MNEPLAYTIMVTASLFTAAVGFLMCMMNIHYQLGVALAFIGMFSFIIMLAIITLYTDKPIYNQIDEGVQKK